MRKVHYPVEGAVPIPGRWADRGACRSYPPEWWYPGGHDVMTGRTRKECEADAAVAMRICLELCLVRAECLVHALRYGELGIWGGLTEGQRRKLNVRPRRVA